MTEGHFQSGQSLAPFTAGHPQASSIDTLTDKLLGDTGQGPPAGAKTHSTPILYQGLSNPSPIVPGPAPERTNCSVQGDTATAAAAAADQHADLAEPPLELSASSLLSQRQSPAMTSSSLSALQSPGQTPSALPADQTENIYLRPASSSLGHEHDSGQSSPSSDHISAGSQELSVSCAQVSSASQRPSSSGHVSHTSQHPSSSSHQAQAASHSSSASDAGQHPSSSPGPAQEAAHSPAASVHYAQAAGLEHSSSSSYTPPVRHKSLAEPSTGWQHYRQSGIGNRGTDTHNARDAAGDEDEAGLKRWVEEVQQHEEQLTQKVCGHAAGFDFAFDFACKGLLPLHCFAGRLIFIKTKIETRISIAHFLRICYAYSTEKRKAACEQGTTHVTKLAVCKQASCSYLSKQGANHLSSLSTNALLKTESGALPCDAEALASHMPPFHCRKLQWMSSLNVPDPRGRQVLNECMEGWLDHRMHRRAVRQMAKRQMDE